MRFSHKINAFSFSRKEQHVIRKNLNIYETKKPQGFVDRGVKQITILKNRDRYGYLSHEAKNCSWFASSTLKKNIFLCVPFGYLYFLIFFYNEPEFGVGIDPGMALTPLPSSIGQGSNPRPSDCERSALPLDHSFCWYVSSILQLIGLSFISAV